MNQIGLFMKKLRVWMIAAVLTVCGTVANAQLSKGHFFKTFRGKAVPVATAERHFAEWFSLSDGTEWKLVSNSTDRLGMSRLEYRQYVDGVEVEHSQILLHTKGSQVMSANGTVMETSTAPRTTAKVRRSGMMFANPTATDELGREVMLVSTRDGYRYATKVLSANGREWVYNDVETGERLKSVPTVYHLDTPTGTTTTVTGKSIFSGDVPLTVTQTADGKNYLYDPQRNIHTLVGAYLPTEDQMVEEGIVFKYLPQGNMPDDFEEATKEQIMEWQEMLGNMVKNGELTTIESFIKDFSSYVTNDGGTFSAYKLNTLTINKLITFNAKAEMVELKPSAEDPLLLKLLIRYGTDRDNASNGIIEDYAFMPEKFPTTLDLSKFQEVIPREGVTIEVSMLEIPTLEGLGNQYEYNEDEEGDDEEDDDEEEDTPKAKYKLLASFTLTPSADDKGSHSFSNALADMSVTYEESSDPTADIHWGMARTLDYYKEKFDRSSYDDKGAPVYNLVYLYNNDEESLIASPLCNAAANSKLAPYPMVYGLGGYDSNVSKIDMLPVVELSVMSHEFTHLVTGQTAKLVYEGESGAINESFSDVMGISVCKRVKGDDYGWLIGGYGQMVNDPNMRDMAHPENSGDGNDKACPNTYKGENWTDTDDTSAENDNGGVHTNSGVQNKWYYLLTDGDKGTNDHGYSYDVKGIGLDKSEQIAYRTLTVYATRESQYADIREASLQAAKDLYGESSAEVKSVGDAWDAVGVNGQGDVPDGIAETAVASATTTTTVYDLQGRPVVPAVAGIYIQNGRKVAIK